MSLYLYLRASLTLLRKYNRVKSYQQSINYMDDYEVLAFLQIWLIEEVQLDLRVFY